MTTEMPDIRELVPADVDALEILHARCFPIEFGELWYAGLHRPDPARIARCLHDESGVLLAAVCCRWTTPAELEREDRPVLAASTALGPWIVRGVPPVCPDKMILYIQTLAVHPEARRRGYGSALFAAALEAALRIDKAPVLYLHVLADNVGAQKFYEGLGFASLAYLDSYYTIQGRPASAFLYVRVEGSSALEQASLACVRAGCAVS